jgi:iron(III) transport system ATP-binding protein
VLDDVSLAVADGELVAILGPSGCGKTTLLRQIAGFDKPDAGRIAIGEEEVSSAAQHVPPERRRIGIVFQSYALWPHMTVAQNVAYGLTVAGVKEPERTRRVEAALALVDLAGYAQRAPAMLSGGQRQRVALARCLVTEPSLVLLDEPLANLDVHLHAAMEREFSRFHERTGTTMIYITHDQAEAMALADRIAVMHKGRVLQFATPWQLFREPSDAIVAAFVGEGMVVPVEVVEVQQRTCTTRVLGQTVRMRCREAQPLGPATACLRAQALRVADRGIAAKVESVTYEGGRFRIEAAAAGGAPPLHFATDEPCTLARGDAVHLDVVDGWVIPG